MRKIINPCHTKDGNVFCEITFKDGELSIHGVVGPKANGDARGGCGQINMSFAESYPDPTFTPPWTRELFDRFMSTWDQWHLNDMRAGCQHQRSDPAWDTAKEVIITIYMWGLAFYTMRRKVEDATATPEEYAAYQTTKRRVFAATMGFNCPKHETPEIGELLALGMVAIEKTETKTAGWVSHTEHPDGLLVKPCPVCGYKYGSAWLKEDVPPEVLAFLEGLPDSVLTPAWV